MGGPRTPDALTPADGEVLTGLAVAAIAARLAGHALDGDAPPAPTLQSAMLQAHGASFVTLQRAAALRGCIGSLAPVRPLYQDVTRNAVRAMADPRLPPVTAADWPELDVTVTVLSPSELLPCPDRDTLAAALRPGVDGLILAAGSRRATFLPVVWENLREPARFVTALLAKGGWPAGVWPAGLAASRYTTVEFHRPAADHGGRPRPPASSTQSTTGSEPA